MMFTAHDGAGEDVPFVDYTALIEKWSDAARAASAAARKARAGGKSFKKAIRSGRKAYYSTLSPHEQGTARSGGFSTPGASVKRNYAIRAKVWPGRKGGLQSGPGAVPLQPRSDELRRAKRFKKAIPRNAPDQWRKPPSAKKLKQRVKGVPLY
jgi:hypothetical protein